ncbi:MAG: oligosaccharide flippase family protein, partial [Candidatus Odinarchaeia archaeon]
MSDAGKENVSISKKAAVSGVWAFTVRILSRAAYFIQLLVLAALLSPDDFGLMGIALLSISALETLTLTGFNEAIIQRKEYDEDHLNSAWAISIIRGIILSVTLIALSPLIAGFFGDPAISSILIVVSSIFLFTGLNNVGVIFFRKELEFKQQFLFQSSGIIADVICSIVAAFILRNVWALIIGLLAKNIVMLLVSYKIHPYRPKLKLNLSKAKELFSFGKWFLISTVIVFLLTQGDDILVGKLLGIAALGLYQMAYNLSNIPATEITHVVSEVTFP